MTPENAITIEGRSVADAVREAAKQLSIDESLIQHKIDITHFKTDTGRSAPRDTVKIFAWARDPSELAGALAAKEWLAGLIEKMELEAKIEASVSGENKARLAIDSPNARHLVGRQGITLRSIRHLLVLAMEGEYPNWKFDLDVLGRGRDDRDSRGEGRERGGRDRDRGGRDRDRDRSRRDDRGGRGRGRRDDRGDDRKAESVKKLKRLARRLAEEAVDKDEPVVIRRSLNSYERRVVHMEVAEIEGVHSYSQMDEESDQKRLVIAPGAGEA